MARIVVASTHKEAGKTSLIIGLGRALSGQQKKVGYCKPFGDRIHYQDKQSWDYDSALVIEALNLQELPNHLTLGFSHSKIRFMYNKKTTHQKLQEIVTEISKNKDLLFIEGSKELSCGLTVFLDPFSVARTTKSKVLLVLSGDPDTILDDITFLCNRVKTDDIEYLGVIVNQVKDIEGFNNTYLEPLKESGIPILGILPYEESLQHFTMDYLNQTLSAKVIAGGKGMQNRIQHIFVGAMSATTVVQKPLWTLENKLIITPGDRPDMIIAALDSSTAGIVLTNGILPEDPKIEALANSRRIPLLSIPDDTFAAAKKIDRMEILFTADEIEKISLLEKLVSENVDLNIFTE